MTRTMRSKRPTHPLPWKSVANVSSKERGGRPPQQLPPCTATGMGHWRGDGPTDPAVYRQSGFGQQWVEVDLASSPPRGNEAWWSCGAGAGVAGGVSQVSKGGLVVRPAKGCEPHALLFGGGVESSGWRRAAAAGCRWALPNDRYAQPTRSISPTGKKRRGDHGKTATPSSRWLMSGFYPVFRR